MQIQGVLCLFTFITFPAVLVLTENISDELAALRDKYCLKIEDFTTPMRESDILGTWLIMRADKDTPCAGPSEVNIATDEAKEFWRKRCIDYNEAVDIDDYDYSMPNNNNTDIPFSLVSSKGAHGSILGIKCEVLNLDFRKIGPYKVWIVMGFMTCDHPFPMAITGPNPDVKTRCAVGYKDFNLQNKNAERYTVFFC